MKAILIMGMPYRCGECPLCIYDKYGYFYCGRTAKKVDNNKKNKNCPLKPMPEKLNAFEEWIKVERPHREQYVSKELENQVIGYNRCIDEILVEQE